MVKPNRKKKRKFLFTLQPNPNPYPFIEVTTWFGLLILFLTKMALYILICNILVFT